MKILQKLTPLPNERERDFFYHFDIAFDLKMESKAGIFTV